MTFSMLRWFNAVFPLPGKTWLKLTTAGLFADDTTFLDFHKVVGHTKDYSNKYIILQIILTQVDGRVHTTTIQTVTVGNDIAGNTFERFDRNTDRPKSIQIYRAISHLNVGDFFCQECLLYWFSVVADLFYQDN